MDEMVQVLYDLDAVVLQPDALEPGVLLQIFNFLESLQKHCIADYRNN
jgi:hypothetical protein